MNRLGVARRAVVGAMVFVTSVAQARAGGGKSFGSYGGRSSGSFGASSFGSSRSSSSYGGSSFGSSRSSGSSYSGRSSGSFGSSWSSGSSRSSGSSYSSSSSSRSSGSSYSSGSSSRSSGSSYGNYGGSASSSRSSGSSYSGGSSYSSGSSSRSSSGGSSWGSWFGGGSSSSSASAPKPSAPSPAPRYNPYPSGGTTYKQTVTPKRDYSMSGSATASGYVSRPSTAGAPPRVTPPNAYNKDQYKYLAPANAVRTESRISRKGSLVQDSYDQAGNKSTVVVGADGAIKREMRTNDKGEVTNIDHVRGVTRTRSAAGQPFSEQYRNTLTGVTRTTTTDPTTGNRQTYVNRPDRNPYVYTTRPIAVGGGTIYGYQPSYNYSNHDDVWFYLWLTETMKHSHGGGGSTYSGGSTSYGRSSDGVIPQATPPPLERKNPTETWAAVFPNLPSELATSKTYEDPTEYVADYVTYGMISNIRGAVDAEIKENEAQMCAWWQFWCTNPPPKYSAEHLANLKTYTLDYNVRTQLHAHAVETLEAIRQGKTISVKDILPDDSPIPTVIRTYVVQQLLNSSNSETDDTCTLDEGDAVKMTAWFPGSNKASVEVLSVADDDAESCKVGSKVTVDISDVQDMENDFAQRVEMATALVSKRFK